MNLDFDAMTAGVKPGGLNSKHTIRVLMCYLIDSVKEPITQYQLERAMVENELVNFFEIGDALSRLEKSNLIVKSDGGGYTVTSDGHMVAQSLHDEIPLTVREQAYKAAINCMQYTKLAEYTRVSVKKTEQNDYLVACKIMDGEIEIFSVSMTVDEEELADFIEKRVFNKGKEIYQCMLATLTGSPGLYGEAMKVLKEM